MMSELKQKSCISVKLDLLQQKAINFYRKNCQSIEIVKDDELQKVNFRVKNKVYNLDKYPKYYIVWCWWTPHSNDWLQFVVFSFLLFIKKHIPGLGNAWFSIVHFLSYIHQPWY